MRTAAAPPTLARPRWAKVKQGGWSPITALSLDSMDYKVVRRSHVVPRGYLRGFAVGESIAMRLVGESTSRVIPVSKAAVLKDFYLRHRPDGTPIHDIEWSLEHIDKAVPPIFREISQRWPLTLPDKAIVAEFIAMQMLRGPRWRTWHTDFVSDYIASAGLSGAYEGKQPDGMTVEEALAEVERQLTSDTATLAKMLELSRKVAQIIGSMHWTLVGFDRAWLATSDHPVATWPVGLASRRSKKSDNFVEGGLTNTLEVRFPVSSHHAILLTWLDLPDDEAPIANGTKDIAANLNAFTVADAEHQWFHVPGVTPPRASGQLLPVAPYLLPASRADLVRESVRRNETNRRIQLKVGETDARSEFEVLTIHSPCEAPRP